MIDEVYVKDLALIQEASFQPASGLTVLTGETGAGKTALLQAMHLLMGERADKTAVRDGASELAINGRLFLSSSEAEDGEELVVVRTVSADGRSRVTINGMMASVNELAERVSGHIDLCGQHEHQTLLKPATHAALLDEWAKDTIAQPLECYQAAFVAAQDAAAELERMQEASSISAARIEDARFTLRQIDAVSPTADEYEELAAELTRAEHAEALATAANNAYVALHEENGALDAISQAALALESAAGFDAKLGEIASQLREASIAVDDAANRSRQYRDASDFDPARLQQTHERMSAIQGLLRTYGPRVEDVLVAREAALEQISLVDDAEARIRDAQAACDAAEASLAHAAYALKAAREQAAPRFAAAVTQQMSRLEMGSAELTCSITNLPREQWGMRGPQAIEFLFAPGAAMTPRSFVRIASGGEMSRVMLAIKVVLGAADDVDTLVFDEIDAGVGGATALALADVVAELAKTHQVIVVTHLAQLAVRGDVHYVVTKTNGEFPQTQLQRIEGVEREQEIARMLSGELTQTSLAHARELLAGVH